MRKPSTEGEPECHMSYPQDADVRCCSLKKTFRVRLGDFGGRSIYINSFLTSSFIHLFIHSFISTNSS